MAKPSIYIVIYSQAYCVAQLYQLIYSLLPFSQAASGLTPVHESAQTVSMSNSVTIVDFSPQTFHLPELMAPVLRRHHTLQRASKTPLIKRIRRPDRIPVLARLARDVDLDTLREEDLVAAIHNLTGESTQDLWEMVGHQTIPTKEELKVVLHNAITLALWRSKRGMGVLLSMVYFTCVSYALSETCMSFDTLDQYSIS